MMKKGKSLVELAAELERIDETKRDFLVPVTKLHMTDTGELEFANGEVNKFGVNNWASAQVASFADIPKQYHDRLKIENPALLAQNVNHGFAKQVEQSKNMPTRMVRTLDGKVRGFLSNSYRRLDSSDLMREALPLMADHKMSVISSEITDQRMYIKAVTDQIQGEIKKGDVVQYGLTISTSDVGGGALRVEPFINRLVCMNGLIMGAALRTSHLTGRKTSEGVEELLSQETMNLEDAAYWSKVRDVIQGILKSDYFANAIAKLQMAANDPIKNYDLIQVVELTNKAIGLNLTKDVQQDIVAALGSGNEGAGLTRWGLINAFTRGAQSDKVNYDESVMIERAASNIIELSPKLWREIAAV